jgi:adenosylhomocysteine nucleosidase
MTSPALRPGVVLVVAPMRSELRPVVRALRARREEVRGVRVHRGRAGRRVVVAALVGVGPDAARKSTYRLLDVLDPTHVVLSGIAGGIGPGTAVGDMVVPETVVDLVTGREYSAAAAPDVRPSGRIGTVDELILDPTRLEELVDRQIVALDMETAAVAEACAAFGRPWSAFRAISDRPQDGLLSDDVMTMLRPDGSVDLPVALRHLAANPGRIPALVRLGRDASAAASRAARASVRAAAGL